MIALVVARDGVLPLGADEAVAEAAGRVLVVGHRAGVAAQALTGAVEVQVAETGVGLRAQALSAALAAHLADEPVVVLPHSPDGRDLAGALAVAADRSLLAAATRVSVEPDRLRASLSRVDQRVAVDATCPLPAVVTLLPGVRSPARREDPPTVTEVELALAERADPEVLELLEPDPATMDLADAPRVLAGGAGLVPRDATDEQARETFAVLERVAAALGASAGATRVVTDAGWMSYERQIGTTGVTVDPTLYVALGISGASQHTGGLGEPAHVVSVNTDADCPMMAMADVAVVTDAHALLLELADRLGVA